MESLIKVINKILYKFEEKYDRDIIIKAIMNGLIVIIWEYNMFSEKYLKDICFEDLNKKDCDEILYTIKTEISEELLKKPEILPVAYEYMIKDSIKKKKYSIYYTPEWIVSYLINRSFKYIKYKDKDIRELKILEPSCGCGMVLIKVFDTLYDIYEEKYHMSPEEIIISILENNLYGIDIDGKAIKYCRYALLHKSLMKTVKKSTDIKFNLFASDFLVKNNVDNIKFDMVIGNPPYLENRGINKYYDKTSLKKRYSTAVGRFDIFSIFIEKSITLLKDNGILAFVIPGSILANNNFTVTRKIILDNTYIREIISLGDNIFKDVGMNMSIIIVKKEQNIKRDNKLLCKNIALSNEKEKELFNNDYRVVPQKYYNNLLNYVFDIDSSDITFRIREKICSSDYYFINDICEVIAGIATGNIRKKLVARELDGNITKRVLEGKNVYNYYFKWSGLYIRDDKSLINRMNGEYATFMRKEFIYNNKILIRQTADRFICAYDNQNYYLLNTLYSLIIREEYKNSVDIKYILALLNSKFYSFLYRSIVREKGKLFPQLKIFHIQYSPLIMPVKSVQREFINKVNQIILKYNELNTIKNIEYKEIYKLQIDIEILRNSIDYMVYKLFNLSCKEIEEVEREMGKSPVKNKITTVTYPEIIKNELDIYKDIILVAEKFKVNPLSIYEII